MCFLVNYVKTKIQSDLVEKLYKVRIANNNFNLSIIK